MADEKAVLARAMEYLTALSQGKDPLTGNETDDSVLSQERLRRCFAFVAAYLSRELSRETAPTGALPVLSPEAQEKICADDAVSAGDFSRRLNEVLLAEGQPTVPPKAINHWLLRAGFVDGRVESVFVDRKVLRANDRSEQIGIFEKTGISARTGELTRSVMFSPETQRWLLQHLPEILSDPGEEKSDGKNAEGNV